MAGLSCSDVGTAWGPPPPELPPRPLSYWTAGSLTQGCSAPTQLCQTDVCRIQEEAESSCKALMIPQSVTCLCSENPSSSSTEASPRGSVMNGLSHSQQFHRCEHVT